MPQIFLHNGIPVTGVQAELAFQRWYLSLATEGLIAEPLRNALTASNLFASARIRSDNEWGRYARGLLARACIEVQQ